jgi:ribosome-associated protein
MSSRERTAPIAVSILSETISLGAFIKLAGVVRTGGEAKLLIQRGLVLVNGGVELRRHHHLRIGDTVMVAGGMRYIVHAPQQTRP